MIKTEITKGDLLKQDVDAIVNPANSTGYMGYGAAKAIVQAGGKAIEDEAVEQAPLIIGDAVATTAGSLPYQAVIHSATVDDPNRELQNGNISKAVLGALLLADDMGFETVAMPGMGSGVAGAHVLDVAESMFAPLKEFKPFNLKKVVFVDLNDEMVDAWERVKSKRAS